MKVNPSLRHVREIKETTDIKEVAQMLSTGEWIAISATCVEPYRFYLGRIELIEIKVPSNR